MNERDELVELLTIEQESNRSFTTQLADAQETIKHLRGKAEFDMPDDMRGKHFNACTDPCDMIDGPCACGAWHNVKEWLEKLLKYLGTANETIKTKDIIIKQLNRRLDDIGAQC